MSNSSDFLESRQGVQWDSQLAEENSICDSTSGTTRLWHKGSFKEKKKRIRHLRALHEDTSAVLREEE